jgi:quinol monooxygenase YgiN
MSIPPATEQFYIFGNVNFFPDSYDAWQGHYDTLAEYVWPNEPRCLTYYFGVPLEYASNMSKTTHMLAFEAYVEREDLYKVHMESKTMGGFLKEIPACMSTGLDLSNYRCTAGWLDGGSSKGVKKECMVMRDLRIRCKDGKSREAVLARLGKLIAGVEGKEDGALTLMAFENLDDDVGVRVFSRWSERDEMESFDRKKEAKEFWLASKDEVASMEWQCYAPNGKGWLHR